MWEQKVPVEGPSTSQAEIVDTESTYESGTIVSSRNEGCGIHNFTDKGNINVKILSPGNLGN
jgi:hypothetical protein